MPTSITKTPNQLRTEASNAALRDLKRRYHEEYRALLAWHRERLGAYVKSEPPAPVAPDEIGRPPAPK